MLGSLIQFGIEAVIDGIVDELEKEAEESEDREDKPARPAVTNPQDRATTSAQLPGSSTRVPAPASARAETLARALGLRVDALMESLERELAEGAAADRRTHYSRSAVAREQGADRVELGDEVYLGDNENSPANDKSELFLELPPGSVDVDAPDAAALAYLKKTYQPRGSLAKKRARLAKARADYGKAADEKDAAIDAVVVAQKAHKAAEDRCKQVDARIEGEETNRLDGLANADSYVESAKASIARRETKANLVAAYQRYDKARRATLGAGGSIDGATDAVRLHLQQQRNFESQLEWVRTANRNRRIHREQLEARKRADLEANSRAHLQALAGLRKRERAIPSGIHRIRRRMAALEGSWYSHRRSGWLKRKLSDVSTAITAARAEHDEIAKEARRLVGLVLASPQQQKKAQAIHATVQTALGGTGRAVHSLQSRLRRFKKVIQRPTSEQLAYIFVPQNDSGLLGLFSDRTNDLTISKLRTYFKRKGYQSKNIIVVSVRDGFRLAWMRQQFILAMGDPLCTAVVFLGHGVDGSLSFNDGVGDARAGVIGPHEVLDALGGPAIQKRFLFLIACESGFTQSRPRKIDGQTVPVVRGWLDVAPADVYYEDKGSVIDQTTPASQASSTRSTGATWVGDLAV